MITPNEFSRIKLGTCIEFVGNTYFIVGSNECREIQNDAFPWCCTYQLVSLVDMPITLIGYNIENPLEKIFIDPFNKLVSIAKKQFTEEEKQKFYIKLVVTGYVQNEAVIEPSLKQGFYYMLHMPFKKDALATRLNDTKDAPVSKYFRSMVSDTYLVRPVEGGFEVYAAFSKVNGNLYVYKKTDVKIGTTDKVLKPLEQTLIFPFWKENPVDFSSIIMSDVKISSPLDDIIKNRTFEVMNKLHFLKQQKSSVYNTILCSYRNGNLRDELWSANKGLGSLWLIIAPNNGTELQTVIGADKTYYDKMELIFNIYEQVLSRETIQGEYNYVDLREYLDLSRL